LFTANSSLHHLLWAAPEQAILLHEPTRRLTLMFQVLVDYGDLREQRDAQIQFSLPSERTARSWQLIGHCDIIFAVRELCHRT
jgi:hypothetical protein